MSPDVDLISALVRTQAFKVAPPGELFWYTSGTVGPYYINTHYLFGGPQRAQQLLSYIDAARDDADFPARLLERCRAAYGEEADYRAAVDGLVAAARSHPQSEGACLVSGGERRDWFFSPLVAHQLGKPHLLLYKDRRARRWDGRTDDLVKDLGGARALHVADLVTEASSYVRAWIPTLREKGGEMAAALNVVDRAQGGLEVIAAAGVPATALLRVDEQLFEALLVRGAIDASQRDVLVAYFRDPEGSMRRFLQEHPEFVERSLASADERTAGRARLLVDQDPYWLKE
ncbi:MAG: orotate phosphoribosyltransferase [Gemmatimonadota bacterium]